MKAILVLLFSLTSYQGYSDIGDAAGGSSKSWTEILNDTSLVPDAFKVKFKNYSISVLDTCYIKKTDTLRTLKHISVFEYVNGLPKSSPPQYFYTPRKYKVEFCGGTSENCEWEVLHKEYPLEFMVDIRRNFNHDEIAGEVLFRKKFQVSLCK